MLMLTKKHATIVAAKDAEIAASFATVTMYADIIAHGRNVAAQLSEECSALEARLAVFTAPRARNAKGHFISAKGANA